MSLNRVEDFFIADVGDEGGKRGGTRLSAITRHMLGLFRGVPGARGYRRHLATEAVKPGAGAEVLAAALALIVDRIPASTPAAA